MGDEGDRPAGDRPGAKDKPKKSKTPTSTRDPTPSQTPSATVTSDLSSKMDQLLEQIGCLSAEQKLLTDRVETETKVFEDRLSALEGGRQLV